MNKYYYTFEELGLDTTQGIGTMKVGKKGFKGYPGKALLCITQGTKVHFYSYSGGKICEEEDLWHWEKNTGLRGLGVATNSKLYPNVFAIIIGGGGYEYGYACLLINVDENENQVYINQYYIGNYSMGDAIYEIKFSSNENYLLISSVGFGRYGWTAGESSVILPIEHDGDNYNFLNCKYVSNEAGLTMLPNEQKVLLKGKLYSVNYNNVTNTITLTLDGNTDYLGLSGYAFSGFSADGTKLWVGLKTTSLSQIYVYTVDWNANNAWTPNQTIQNFEASGIQVKEDLTIIIGDPTGTLNIARKNNTPNIIAVRYKNQFFYKNAEEVE